jgi:hypothetical protein
MKAWIARLSLSFFILAFLLIWELNRTIRDSATTPGASTVPFWKIALFVLGACLCAALGGMGIRFRHRDNR